MLELLEHDADLGRRQRTVLGREGSNRSRTDVIGRVRDLLAMENGEGVDLLQDIPHMDGCRRRAPFHDLGAVCAQVIRRDLGQQPIPPDGLEFALEDGAAHGARAVGHGRACQPLLSELTEALGILDPTLVPLLLDGW